MNKRLSSNQDDFRRELQKKFFRIVEQQVSSFLPDLAGEPYQKILLAGIHEDEFWGRPQEDLIVLLRERATPAVDAFADALIGWTRKYHIETNWVMRDAFQLLSWWKEGRIPVGEDTRSIVIATDSPACDTAVFSFEFIASGQGVDDILKRMDEAYQQRRNRFREGLLWHQATIRKPEKALRVNSAHLLWFVLYQCGDVSMAEIAQTFEKEDFRTVRKGIKPVASDLGIELRPPDAGRVIKRLTGKRQ